jgi:hypothetical protein
VSGPVDVVMRCAPILTVEDIKDVDKVRHHELFQSGSLTPVRRGIDENGHDIYLETPVCINHEKENVVGVVRHLYEDEDVRGGRWLFASARVTDPPGWLSRDSHVSISYKCLKRESGLRQEWTRVMMGWLTEISLLAPTRKPAFPAARVLCIWPVEEPSSTSPAVATDRAAAGEFYGGQVLVRPGIGQVLGVR